MNSKLKFFTLVTITCVFMVGHVFPLDCMKAYGRWYDPVDYFDLGHSCHSCRAQSISAVCKIHNEIKVLDSHASENIMIAVHRGVWGGRLGAGAPENSGASFLAAVRGNYSIWETDVMVANEDELVVFHDYAFDRMTEFSGFTYETDINKLRNMNLRRRDHSISEEKLLGFDEMLQLAYDNNAVVTVDIKEKRSLGTGENCTRNCAYQDSNSKKDHWLVIVNKILNIGTSIEALDNLIIKTHFTYEEVFSGLGDKMNRVLWMPVSFGPRFESPTEIISYFEFWNSHAGKQVALYEPNFFSADDCFLQPFSTINSLGETQAYQNTLHYLVSVLNVRPAMFSEDPVDRKGVVDKWGGWKTKNADRDFRGNFAKLMGIPYFQYMFITTDRPEVWRQIKRLVNQIH